MIRINLAPSKRNRHEDRSQQELLAGLLVLIVLGAALFFLVDRPIRERIDAQTKTNNLLRNQNRAKQEKLKDFKKLKAAVESAEKRQKVVERLNDARATPAHMLHELSQLLTSAKRPTMTADMIADNQNNPNRQFKQEWDAKHIWVTSFKEKGGDFTLKGGAQSDSDMTQLALRLQSSVYFYEVTPEGGVEVTDRDTGISYYQFTIKGKVAY